MQQLHSDQPPRCPGCGSAAIEQFYTALRAPVQSMLLLATAEEARAIPTGTITLAFCRACGLISNTSFDPATQEFSEKYEASQGFSATFNAFHRRLALDLIARYGLRGKRVIEIGCGQGEFLTLLCELGDNEALGFDPVVVPERAEARPELRLRFVKDFYDERFAGEAAELICCKMTLEHIHRPAELLATVRRAIGDRRDTRVFFQIPNALPILRAGDFWEIYYEHCSYFSPGALARLFRRCGFAVVDLWTDYDDQYLMIDARPAAPGEAAPPHPAEEPIEELAALVARFGVEAQGRVALWRERLAALQAASKQIALWGSGSRGVGFLTTLGATEPVGHVVDINPYRQGMYMAGTGQPIVAPEALRRQPPDAVIVMNPIYCEEIGRQLQGLGLASELLVP